MQKYIYNGNMKIFLKVDGVIFGEPYGIWATQPVKKVERFKSFIDLITSIDDFYNLNGFVKEGMSQRSLVKKVKSKACKKTEVIVDMTEINLTSDKGEKATFIVQILFRQNATWQGKLTWLETGKETKFRSTMEMIKMMDEALQENSQSKNEDEIN